MQGYDLAVDNIGYAEFVDTIAGPAALLTFTGAGFWIGGMPGAAAGMVVALPVQIYIWCPVISKLPKRSKR